jgi:hypothetical protein
MIDYARINRQIVSQRIRADLVGVENTLTEDDWMCVLTASQGVCFYCNKTVGENNLVIDHRIPVTKGGGNVRLNIVAACVRCNGRKGNRVSPEIQNISARRLGDDEIQVQLGAHKIRMFDYEVERLISTLNSALNSCDR